MRARGEGGDGAPGSEESPELLLARVPGILLSILGYCFAVALPATIVSASYFGNSVSSLLVYRAADGWCDAGSEGIGVHCFGDFHVIRLALADPSVWDNRLQQPIPYPPVAMWPNVLADWADRIGLGVRGSMLLFLLALAVAALTPAAWAAWRLRRRFPSGVVVALVGAMTLPVFVVLDRGNNMAFALPPLLGYLIGLRWSTGVHRWIAPVCLVIVIMLRPQFVVVGLLLLVVGRWRDLILAGAASGLAMVGSFIVWDSRRWTSHLSEWFHNIGSFDQYQSLRTVYPSNISAPRSLVMLSESLNGFGGSLGDDVGDFVIQHTKLVTFLMLGITGALFVLSRTRLPIGPAIVIALTAAVIAPGVQHPYYLTIALLIAVVFLVPDAFHGLQGSRARFLPTRAGPLWICLVLVALVVSLVPVPFAAGPGRPSIGVELAGPLWLLVWSASIVICVVDVRPVRRARRGLGSTPGHGAAV